MGLFSKKNIDKMEPTSEEREIRIRKLQEQKQILGLKQQEIDIERDIRKTKFDQSPGGTIYNFGAKVFGNLKAKNKSINKSKSSFHRAASSMYADKDKKSIYQQAETKSNIEHFTSGFSNPFIQKKKR